jgi:hypothetical protein
MSVVYSLYDALVSINVPDEKARAVIDAMEREMMNTLATRTDVAHAVELLSRDIQAAEERMLDRTSALDDRLSRRIDGLEAKVTTGFQAVDAKFAAFEERWTLLLKSELGDLKHAMTLRLGGMIMGTVVLIGALLSVIQALR